MAASTAAVRFYLKSKLQAGRSHLATSIFGTANRFAAATVAGRRGVHSTSVYEKNLDYGNGPAALVPDDVIGGAGGAHERYWAPNPTTGVFGPPSDSASADLDQHQLAATTAAPGASSVLDQPAWFRAVDGVDY